VSFSFPPTAKFAPNSRNDALLARSAASIRAELEAAILSPLTYDLFKLCFYRCLSPHDYLYHSTLVFPRAQPLLAFRIATLPRAHVGL